MFQLPKLNYSYDALEPHIDAKTMEIHYTKHHQGYTDKLNAAIVDMNISSDEELISLFQNPESIPQDKRSAVINNGGGYLNHKLFWEIMSPDSEDSLSGVFEEILVQQFGSIESFKEEFSQAALTRFGSGWAWLVVNEEGQLEVVSTSNQDNPISENKTPILALDVWEHAYYLKYQNKRAEYIENWWRVVDWSKVEELYNSKVA
jgi:Fe-Mn family superoxide dismutase